MEKKRQLVQFDIIGTGSRFSSSICVAHSVCKTGMWGEIDPHAGHISIWWEKRRSITHASVCVCVFAVPRPCSIALIRIFFPSLFFLCCQTIVCVCDEKN